MAKHAFISPDFFSVAPQLIGKPLAGPARRGLAMIVDLLLVALLVKAGGAFLGLAAVFTLLRASQSQPNAAGGFLRKSVRFTLRAIAALVLFLVALKLWDYGEDRIGAVGDDDAAADTTAVAQQNRAELANLNLNFSPRDIGNVTMGVAGLASADSEADVQQYARRLLETAKRAGATNAQLWEARGELIEIMDEPDSADVAAFDATLLAVAGPAPPKLTGADSLRAVIADLNRNVEQLDQQNDSLGKELEQAREKRGIRGYLGALLDDLGLGFGWAAVYFTGFLAMMRGQTPGKKLMRVRVIRLDGKPLGWWISFERFGGYAASLSVGLLGFIQILWDRNRQGLHDKACETVVVSDKGQPAARS